MDEFLRLWHELTPWQRYRVRWFCRWLLFRDGFLDTLDRTGLALNWTYRRRFRRAT